MLRQSLNPYYLLRLESFSAHHADKLMCLHTFHIQMLFLLHECLISIFVERVKVLRQGYIKFPKFLNIRQCFDFVTSSQLQNSATPTKIDGGYTYIDNSIHPPRLLLSQVYPPSIRPNTIVYFCLNSNYFYLLLTLYRVLYK